MSLFPPVITEIHSEEIVDGQLIINQDTYYDLSKWTVEDAKKDYCDPEVALKRAQDEWSSWVD